MIRTVWRPHPAGYVTQGGRRESRSDAYVPAVYHADAADFVICPVCGKRADAAARFCDQCAAKLSPSAVYVAEADEPVRCPVCRCMNDDDAYFCDQCGTQLGGRTDALTFAPLLANSRPLPKGRFADQASWMRWLNSAAGPSTRPHTTAAHPDRTTRLAHDERKWMRVCTKSFQYRDEFGLHKFVAGVSFAVPQTDRSAVPGQLGTIGSARRRLPDRVAAMTGPGRGETRATRRAQTPLFVCPICEGITPLAEAVQVECAHCGLGRRVICRDCLEREQPGVLPAARPGWVPVIALSHARCAAS